MGTNCRIFASCQSRKTYVYLRHHGDRSSRESSGNRNARAQTTQALRNIKGALESVGAKLEDVVRTRIYLTDISEWEEIGRIHGEFFAEI